MKLDPTRKLASLCWLAAGLGLLGAGCGDDGGGSAGGEGSGGAVSPRTAAAKWRSSFTKRSPFRSSPAVQSASPSSRYFVSPVL